MSDWQWGLGIALVIFAIIWAGNHIHDKLQSLEWLLIDIKNYLDNRLGPDDD